MAQTVSAALENSEAQHKSKAQAEEAGAVEN
jgi:hypothetical protein